MINLVLAIFCGFSAILNYKLEKPISTGIMIACMVINIFMYLNQG